MPKTSPESEFLTVLQHSLEANRFVRLKLSSYTGTEPALREMHARKILVKGQEKLSITSRYATKDIVKNYSDDEALAMIADWLASGFASAALFTLDANLQWDGRKQKLQQSAPTEIALPSLTHDRDKSRLVSTQGKPYLHALKITDANGKVIPSAQDKYRQIDKYIEILSGLVRALPDTTKTLRVVDMGSGKGYLTFALYDYLTAKLGRKAEVTGVEYRQDMVDLCNGIARDSAFTSLNFVQGTIEQYNCSGADIVIALHACDTATDDAIASAIAAEASIIVVAPCCHKQIRREMEAGHAKNDLGFLLKHGTLLERQAEMVTDGMRAQLLEYAGYQTKLFEFISDAHTPKNVMIVGQRAKTTARNPAALEAMQQAKTYFGIGHHHLEKILGAK